MKKILPVKTEFTSITFYADEKYLQCLPESLVHNPNVQQILSLDLYQDIVSSGYIVQSHPRVLSEQELTQIIESTLKKIAYSTNQYHNQEHTEQVIECCKILATATSVAIEDQQLLILAALFHDFGHSGTTLRQQSPNALKNEISNEEFACIKADEYLAKHLSLQQRIELQGLILATSFGQKNPDIADPTDKAKIQRNYEPYSKLEHLLALADIGRFLLGFDIYVQGSLAFLKESNLESLTFSQWCQNEINFIVYTEQVLDGMHKLIPKHYFSKYKTQIKRIIAKFEQAKTNHTASSLKEKFLENFYS